MAERLTMKGLSAELETMRKQISKLEQQLERKLETTLEKALEKLKSRTEASGDHVAGTGIGAEERQRLIGEVAYLRAERRGFEGGDPEQDWLEAEEEVNRLLMQGTTRRVKTGTRKRAATKRKS